MLGPEQVLPEESPVLPMSRERLPRPTRTGETVKPLTILYNLVKLPLVIVKDVAATPMDMMENCTPFEDTRRLCDKLDQLLTRKP